MTRMHRDGLFSFEFSACAAFLFVFFQPCDAGWRLIYLILIYKYASVTACGHHYIAYAETSLEPVA